MNHESLTNMAKSPDNPKKPEKSQAELRSVLEQRLKSLKPSLDQGVEEYEQASKEGTVEDQDDEPEGSGEARRIAMENKLNALVEQAEKMKARLDSKEPLPNFSPEISVQYTHPDNNQETITLDIEPRLQDFISFYQKTKIDLPPDFEDSIRDIWDRNQSQMEQAIQQDGFNDILIIPPNLPLKDLAEKMKMEDGYYFFQVKDDFSDVSSPNTDKTRIVMVHKVKEVDENLNIQAKDVDTDKALSLEEYLIFQRKYFEETGHHLDEKTATWLSSSAGARFVYSYWNPDGLKLNVFAHDPGLRSAILGVRSSRCFY